MASRPTGNWTRVEIFFEAPMGKEWSNIFWFKQNVPVTSLYYQNDAGVIVGSLQFTIGSVQTTDVTCVGGVVTYNDGAGSYSVEVYLDAAGSLTGTLVPEDVSLVVQRLTANGGPSNRGRIFITGFPTTYINGSYTSSTGYAAFNMLAGNLTNAIAGAVANYAPYLFSPTTAVFEAITGHFPVNLLATSRRRRPRF